MRCFQKKRTLIWKENELGAIFDVPLTKCMYGYSGHFFPLVQGDVIKNLVFPKYRKISP